MSQFKTSILILIAFLAQTSAAQECEQKLDELPMICPAMVETPLFPSENATLHSQLNEVSQREQETAALYRACLEAQSSCSNQCGREFRAAEDEGDKGLASEIQNISLGCTDFQATINSLKNLEVAYRQMGVGIKEQLKPMRGAPINRSTGPVTAMQTLPGFAPR